MITRTTVTTSQFPPSFFTNVVEYGSLNDLHTDSRSWVVTDEIISYDIVDIQGMVYFDLTGEYDDNYGCEQLMGEWFRHFLPSGSQIDDNRYCLICVQVMVVISMVMFGV